MKKAGKMERKRDDVRIRIRVIGVVENRVKKPLGQEAFSGEVSVITVFPEFSEGLYRIEEHRYLDILFHFHLEKGYSLRDHHFSGEEVGVFASRSPRRPTGIGVTTVRLEKRMGNRLLVRGLDAVDGTPVLDIKPSVNIFNEEEKRIIKGEKA